MQISNENSYEEVCAFYHSMIEAMKGFSFDTHWEKDVYPAPDFLREAIAKRELYTGRMDGRIAAAMVLNHACNPEYACARWGRDLDSADFCVIHALGVHPDFSGKGCGRAMVEHAVATARRDHMKAVRLDVLDGNVYADRLYESCGFTRMDSMDLYYVDTGRTKFDLYELLL